MLAVTIGRVALATLVLIGVTRAEQYPDYQPLAASQYPSYQERQGIGVAAVPMFDTSSQKRYLGIDLSAHGFVPVYVVIENHTNPQSVILLRDQVLYGHDDSALASWSDQQARPGSSRAANSVAAASMSAGGVLGTVGLLIALHMVSNVSNIRMNLLKKELRSQTFAPGKAGGGFVFVPIDKGGGPAKELVLDVPVKDGASNENIHFYFRIDMRSEGK